MTQELWLTIAVIFLFLMVPCMGLWLLIRQVWCEREIKMQASVWHVINGVLGRMLVLEQQANKPALERIAKALKRRKK